MYPEGVLKQDKAGHTPFDVAIGKSGGKFATEEVVSKLFQQGLDLNPAFIKYDEKGNNNNNTVSARATYPPLLKAIKNKYSSGFILSLLDANNAAAAAEVDDGTMALHLFAELGNFEVESSRALVRKLIECNPKSASHPVSSKSKLPLHIACCRMPPSPFFVEFLVTQYPDGCSSKDSEGLLPLHCLLETVRSQERELLESIEAQKCVVQACQILLKSYRQAAEFEFLVQNVKLLPLHCLLQSKNALSELTKCILEAYPEAASVSTSVTPFESLPPPSSENQGSMTPRNNAIDDYQPIPLSKLPSYFTLEPLGTTDSHSFLMDMLKNERIQADSPADIYSHDYHQTGQFS